MPSLCYTGAPFGIIASVTKRPHLLFREFALASADWGLSHEPFDTITGQRGAVSLSVFLWYELRFRLLTIWKLFLCLYPDWNPAHTDLLWLLFVWSKQGHSIFTQSDSGAGRWRTLSRRRWNRKVLSTLCTTDFILAVSQWRRRVTQSCWSTLGTSSPYQALISLLKRTLIAVNHEMPKQTGKISSAVFIVRKLDRVLAPLQTSLFPQTFYEVNESAGIHMVVYWHCQPDATACIMVSTFHLLPYCTRTSPVSRRFPQ